MFNCVKYISITECANKNEVSERDILLRRLSKDLPISIFVEQDTIEVTTTWVRDDSGVSYHHESMDAVMKAYSDNGLLTSFTTFSVDVRAVDMLQPIELLPIDAQRLLSSEVITIVRLSPLNAEEGLHFKESRQITMRDLFIHVNSSDDSIGVEKNQIEQKNTDVLRNCISVNKSTVDITFEEVKIPSMKRIEGLEYLAYLLRFPGKEIHCSELYNSVHGVSLVGMPSFFDSDCHISYANMSHQEQADDKYRRDINHGIKVIDEQIEEAKCCEKFDEIEDLEEKKHKLKNLLSNCSYKGRSKVFTDSSDRRLSIKNSLDRALKLIKNESVPFHEHLAQYLKTGHHVTYKANIQWCVNLLH